MLLYPPSDEEEALGHGDEKAYTMEGGGVGGTAGDLCVQPALPGMQQQVLREQGEERI